VKLENLVANRLIVALREGCCPKGLLSYLHAGIGCKIWNKRPQYLQKKRRFSFQNDLKQIL